MSQAPGARYLRFRRGVWHDRFSDQVQVAKILMAHRVPWLVYDSLAARTHDLWTHASHARVRALCDRDEPMCTECPHDRSQRACIAEVEVELPAGLLANVSNLCPGPYPNRRPGRCPAFVRGTHPDANGRCWPGSPTVSRHYAVP